jgi:hypothetical protein
VIDKVKWFLVGGVYIAHTVALPAHSFILALCADKCGKTGVINYWLNDWFGDTTAHQNFQSQWFLMAKFFHTYLNGVRRLMFRLSASSQAH